MAWGVGDVHIVAQLPEAPNGQALLSLEPFDSLFFLAQNVDAEELRNLTLDVLLDLLLARVPRLVLLALLQGVALLEVHVGVQQVR